MAETKIIRKAFKYRIYPTEEQEVFFNKCFGHGRFIWNYFLDKQLKLYEEERKYLSKFDMDYLLTDLRKEIEWLKEVPSENLRNTLESLDNAWKKFYRKDGGKLTGKPKFKAKGFYLTTTFIKGSTSENIYISNEGLKLPKLKELVKVKYHRKHEGKIKRATVKRSSTGEYFVSISCKIDNPVNNGINNKGKSIGIDLGIRKLVITSEGKEYENHRFYKKYQKKLAAAQRHLSRKKKGSKRYKKQKMKVARLHEKTKNCRSYVLHNITAELTNDFENIFTESIDVKDLIEKVKYLRLGLSDSGWNTLIKQLEYKADFKGGRVLKVDQFYASSKTCNKCGYYNENLKFSEINWECPNCNTLHDRDFNAAKNIKSEGLKILNENEVL